MKRIGVLGGTSWPSTIDYYRLLNEMVHARLGGFHSADLILRSVDYDPIKSSYAGHWDRVPVLLKAALEDLVGMRPDCILVANNTLHKALDEVLDQHTDQSVFSGIPVVHIVRETGKAAKANGYQKLLLLGTKLTMEDGYYAGVLENDFCFDVDVPDEADRNAIQDIQTPLAAGEDPAQYEGAMQDILTRYLGFDAVVPACTELPLVVRADNTMLPVLNPTALQCKAAVEFALEEEA